MTPVAEFRRGEPCPISLPANPPSFQQAPEVCLVECRNWDQAANGNAAIRSRLIGSPIRVEGRRNGYIELALAESYIPIAESNIPTARERDAKESGSHEELRQDAPQSYPFKVAQELEVSRPASRHGTYLAQSGEVAQKKAKGRGARKEALGNIVDKTT
ncbi:hypothetical protein CCHR01_04422 [Colletotrichum chrysophilum]|uniref:Uncharacterized protein n=1 Tax=Colletotrichum chrysophilum TaxID=1836956 RepID=A0AAD9EMK9_9PEZI|nr:hypothetical protein CCHR01_04422 [Colletotrichum chrysophilum]